MSEEFGNLDAGGRIAASLSRNSGKMVLAAVAAAIMLSWALLAWMAASLPATAVGPGWALIDRLPLPELDGFVGAFARLCLSPAGAANPALQFTALAIMWFLMALAMMLPSAAPMIRTYCEIADTAAASGKAVVHPAVLIAGYLLVWLANALVFAGMTIAVQDAIPVSAPGSAWFAAAALAIAGLWQFSPLKEACLRKCRAPFATLFSRWSNRPAGVLRLGIEQGLWCLGCCWALMLVMFAVGIMNLFWMALIGLLAIVEKSEKGRAISRVAGTLLLVWAGALIVVSA